MAGKKKEAETPPKKESFGDFVLNPFKDWFEFMKVGGISYYLGLLKINLVSALAAFLIVAVYLVLVAGIFLVAGGMQVFSDPLKLTSALTNIFVLGAIAILTLVMVIISNYVTRTIGFTAYVFTDAQLTDKPFHIMDAAGSIKGKSFWNMLLEWLISLVISIPAIVVLILALVAGGGLALSASEGTATAGILGALIGFLFAYLIIIIYMLFATYLYEFLSQFWYFGFLAEDVGVVEALKRSLGIIKRRPGEVIVFDILWIIGMLVFSVPLFFYSMVFQVGVRILPYLDIYSNVEAWILIVAGLLMLAVHLLMTLVLTALVSAFLLPTQYLFWKKAKE